MEQIHFFLFELSLFSNKLKKTKHPWIGTTSTYYKLYLYKKKSLKMWKQSRLKAVPNPPKQMCSPGGICTQPAGKPPLPIQTAFGSLTTRNFGKRAARGDVIAGLLSRRYPNWLWVSRPVWRMIDLRRFPPKGDRFVKKHRKSASLVHFYIY